MTRSLIHESLAVGPFQCNCHILADERTKEAVIIDPGDDPGEILQVVKDLGVTVKALMHTHCHLDHMSGTRKVKEETGAVIHIHERDRMLYEGLRMQYRELPMLFGMSMGPGHDPSPVDVYLRDGETYTFGSIALKTIWTPGHTPGSCCFAMETPKDRVVFSGDTLFAGGIGRTDLWGGDHATEILSIKTRLLTLETDTRVLPGHGPETRIGEEREGNPFL